MSLTSVPIFVVEDELMIQECLQSAFEDGGFDVMVASSGEDAVAKLDDGFPTAFRALVTDVNLARGGLTGWDVARHARRLRPELPVVYMTGAAAHEWSVHGVPNSLLLTKPFSPAQMVTAVSRLLSAARPVVTGSILEGLAVAKLCRVAV